MSNAKSNSHDVVEDEDVLEKLLKPTGCLQLHYSVQECIAESLDWRKCKEQVASFRKCMEDYSQRKSENKLKL